MIKLKYGMTNTYFVSGAAGGLLIDTDYAGTLPQFFGAVKTAGIGLRDISYLMMTHYHPDHCGLAGELQGLGVRLLLMDVQQDSVHFSDMIFARDSRLRYTPVNENAAKIIRCNESRAFLLDLGIGGEILHTPSHSADSISLLLDDGCCIVGDLEPLAYLEAYESNPALQADWQKILQHHPKRILYAHSNENILHDDCGRMKKEGEDQ